MKNNLCNLYRKALATIQRWKRNIDDNLLGAGESSNNSFTSKNEEVMVMAAEAGASSPRPAPNLAEEAYAMMILLPKGVPIGKPYKRQEDVRRVNVMNFTEAYNMFLRMGDVEKATMKNKGGYLVYKIEDNKGCIHLELTVKPRRYPKHAIGTLKIKSYGTCGFPLKEVIFCVEPQNKELK